MKKYVLIIALISLIAFITMPVSAYVTFQQPSGVNGWFDQAGGNYNLTDGSAFVVSGLHTFGGTPQYAIGPYGNVNTIMATYGWSSSFRMMAYTCTGINETHCDQIGDNGYGASGSWAYLQNTFYVSAVVHDWIIIRFVNSGYGDPHTVFALSKNTYDPTIAPVSSFTCTPTSQYPDTDVICTDSSTNTPTDWLWMEGINGLPEANWNTATTQNYTFSESYPALYTVKLRANNSAGNDWYNLTDYISIAANATPNTCSSPVVPGYIRSMFQCVDSQTSGAIHGCGINLKDQEGNSWSNTSAALGGTHCIDTLPAHHISGYGSATGYGSTYRTDLLASGTVLYELLMVPGYVPNATAGKVWLYVLVNDINTGAQLSGATVTISGSGQATQTGITDTSGQVSRQWANLSTVYVTATKPGYTTGSKTVNTTAAGPDTVRIELSQGVITVAPTATPGPGGTVAPTIGPYGTPGATGTYAPGYTNNQGQKMMDYLATHGLDLVQLCFLVTVCALLGIKFGK